MSFLCGVGEETGLGEATLACLQSVFGVFSLAWPDPVCSPPPPGLEDTERRPSAAPTGDREGERWVGESIAAELSPLAPCGDRFCCTVSAGAVSSSVTVQVTTPPGTTAGGSSSPLPVWSRECRLELGGGLEAEPSPVSSAAGRGEDCTGEGGVRGGEECVVRESGSEKASIGASVGASEMEDTTEDLLLVQSLCQPSHSAFASDTGDTVRCWGMEAVSRCISEHIPFTVARGGGRCACRGRPSMEEVFWKEPVCVPSLSVLRLVARSSHVGRPPPESWPSSDD